MVNWCSAAVVPTWAHMRLGVQKRVAQISPHFIYILYRGVVLGIHPRKKENSFLKDLDDPWMAIYFKGRKTGQNLHLWEKITSLTTTDDFGAVTKNDTAWGVCTNFSTGETRKPRPLRNLLSSRIPHHYQMCPQAVIWPFEKINDLKWAIYF